MIMGGDKKKLAAMIIARVKPSGDIEKMRSQNEETYKARAGEIEKEDGEDEGLLSAAEEIISAVHAKDASQLVSCLKDFFSMVDKDDDSEEEPESEEEKPSILG